MQDIHQLQFHVDVNKTYSINHGYTREFYQL